MISDVKENNRTAPAVKKLLNVLLLVYQIDD